MLFLADESDIVDCQLIDEKLEGERVQLVAVVPRRSVLVRLPES